MSVAAMLENMHGRQLGLALLCLSACGSTDSTGEATAGSGGVLNVRNDTASCPIFAQSGTGGLASAAENLALAHAQYDRCSARCNQARAANCAVVDYDGCVDYCLSWENRTANGKCTAEIGSYIDCWGTIADACAFPSGPVPRPCAAALTKARCCLGLSPYEPPR